MDNETRARPPIAAKKPHQATYHGVTLSDDYAWLRDPAYPKVEDKEILAHLEAENAWFRKHMDQHEARIEGLFAELRGRIKEADSSVPQKDGDYLYWIEYQEGAEYKRWWRRPVAPGPEGAEDELLLDEAEMAKGKEYFRLGAFSVSEDGTRLAYAVDDNGSERYTVRIKDLVSGALLEDEIPNTLSSLVWAAGDRALIYSEVNEHWRTDKAKLHWLGSPVSDDITLYHEGDEGFRVDCGLSADDKWVVIATDAHDTSEVRLVPAENPEAAPILVRERRSGVEYAADVRGDTIYIHSNDSHENFALFKAEIEQPQDWKTVIGGSDAFYLTGVSLFKDFYVTEGRRAGLDQIAIRHYDEPKYEQVIAFPEASYSASLGNNPEFDISKLRLAYSSMVSPATTYDFDLAGERLETLKVQEIPSGYDASLYTTERLEITARDGTVIPVSIVYRKDRAAGGPLHLYGYGAYGIAIDPGFSAARLSLVDRGFAFAIAHIRGGDDLGRAWYKAGKLDQRTNTFNDFVDVAKGLIERGYSAAGKLSISGGSAGGELMGAVINSNPELWGAVVAHVPFVDVLNTMLDASLPLTPGEWGEWGNPIEDEQAFEYIRSYSPYDQVQAMDYPPLLVTAGLNDPRVTYWEPAKWVAKLRELKTDDNLLLLKTNMGAGHGGKSGRFESLYELAEEFAYILWQMGIEE